MRHLTRPVLVTFIAVSLAVLVTGLAAAHTVKVIGPVKLEIGWQHEPTYVGEANGVEVIVTDASGQPITDLTTDDLKAVVSTGGQQTGELTFDPAFDLAEGDGPLGQYNAPIMPTEPGDYTFHITGSVHGQIVDVTVTSGPDTFDTVRGTTDIQFPTKLPTVTEIVTRLDRIDAGLTSAGPTQAAVDAALKSADDAQHAADRALLVGGGIGLAGLVVASWSLFAIRRRARGPQA